MTVESRSNGIIGFWESQNEIDFALNGIIEFREDGGVYKHYEYQNLDSTFCCNYFSIGTWKQGGDFLLIERISDFGYVPTDFYYLDRMADGVIYTVSISEQNYMSRTAVPFSENKDLWILQPSKSLLLAE